jgi:hypothetical protein
MLVEPFANDEVEDNLNPVGRLFYSVSTLVCTPNSLSQDVGYGLGAQAGERRLREVATKAGFTRFRRATETPFNPCSGAPRSGQHPHATDGAEVVGPLIARRRRRASPRTGGARVFPSTWTASCVARGPKSRLSRFGDDVPRR